MMMEGELGFRRPDGLPFLPPPHHRFDPRLPVFHHQPQGRSLEERIALSLEQRYGGQSSRQEIGGSEIVPFSARVGLSETKSSVPEIVEDKVIRLGKANTNVSGLKRKAVAPADVGASEPLSVGSMKKPKEEWSCAICQVSATSERGLNEHLGGKKHQAKEAGLRAQKAGGSLGLGLVPKKPTKPNKPDEVTASPFADNRLKIEKKSPLLLKNNSSAETGKKNGADGTEDHRRNKFRFWCEMCQAGAYSEKVMNHHKKGKKHAAKLEQLNKNCVAASVTQKAEGSKDVVEGDALKAEDLNEVAEKGTRQADELEKAAEEEIMGASEIIDGVKEGDYREVAEVADNGSD